MRETSARTRRWLAGCAAALGLLCAASATSCRTSAPGPDPGVALAAAASVPQAFGPLEIHHINVQQGDCTLIVGPDGTTVLVDGGNPGRGDAEITPYLASIGIQPTDGLDFMLCTHRDSDHLGGLDEVIAAGYDVTQGIWDNGSSEKQPEAGLTNAELQQSGIQVHQFLGYGRATTAGNGAVEGMPLGREVQLGNGATATCVAVGGAVWNVGQIVTSPEENDQSVALLVCYGDFEYITAGDLGGGQSPADNACTFRTTGQANVETPLAQALMPGGAIGLLTADGVEVLDVNHHGSESSTNHEYMNLLSPRVAVINTGSSQRSNFHHPREDVIERVLRAGVACISVEPALVLQTEEGFPVGANTSFDGACVGDVVIRTTGSGTFEVTATGQVGQGPDERGAVGLDPGPLVFPLDGAGVAAQALIMITEIMLDPSDVPDNAGEWFEVLNPGTQDVDMQGWTIRDDGADSHMIDAPGGSFVVPAGRRLVLGRNSDMGQNGRLAVDYVYSGIQFANGDDELELVDGNGTVVDRVAYTGAAPWPDPTGASMQLVDSGQDNALGSSWAEATVRGGSYAAGGTDLGSPGG